MRTSTNDSALKKSHMLGGVVSLFIFITIHGCTKNNTDDTQIPRVDGDVPISHETTNHEGTAATDAVDGAMVQSVLSVTEPVSPDNVTVTLTVINHTDAPISFCKFHTPFEGALTSGSTFEIKDASGKLMDYQGIMKKRMPPSEAHGDYQNVQPGQTLSASTNIAPSYSFAPGAYQIKFAAPEISQLPESRTIRFEIK